MERGKTNEVNETGEIRFKKVGGGSLRFNNKIIKPGQVFLARPQDIKPGWKDVVIPMDDIPISQETAKKEPSRVQAPEYKKVPKYSKVLRGKSTIWFNVVDAEGTVINQKALREEAADELIASAGFDVVGPSGKIINGKPLKEEEADSLIADLKR